ncbi:MAG: EAL domain-containing protein [Leptolyngbyaceae cyanobacterium]
MVNIPLLINEFEDEKLEQLGDVTNLVLHEFRTPLTSIQGALKLLQNEYYSEASPDTDKLLKIAISATNRLNRLAAALEEGPEVVGTMISRKEISNLKLENSLIQGLERQEFLLHLQPILAIEEKRIIGFEALARWQHPTLGIVPPGDFIPLAEKSGIINELGLYLVRKACQLLHDWQRQFLHQPPFFISINISSIQLDDPRFSDEVEKILSRHTIQPHTLVMEITESSLIENNNVALRTILKLKQMGINFYLDDFGTGYSSLLRLQELPFSAIKIDKSFVAQQNWTISKAILQLADSLQLNVIVEGIETAEQLEVLSGLGCKEMQGYYFSKPIETDCAYHLLSSQI